MEVIKLSFEPTDAWNREEFRHLIYNIKNKLYDKDCQYEYELWIITTNDSTTYINALASQLDIPTDRVILCVDDTTKVGQIVLNTDIHLDINQSIITALNPTTVAGILVDNKIAYQAIGLKYIQDITRWTNAILRDRLTDEGEKIKPC